MAVNDYVFGLGVLANGMLHSLEELKKRGKAHEAWLEQPKIERAIENNLSQEYTDLVADNESALSELYFLFGRRNLFYDWKTKDHNIDDMAIGLLEECNHLMETYPTEDFQHELKAGGQTDLLKLTIKNSLSPELVALIDSSKMPLVHSFVSSENLLNIDDDYAPVNIFNATKTSNAKMYKSYSDVEDMPEEDQAEAKKVKKVKGDD